MTFDEQIAENEARWRTAPELAAMLAGEDECPACGSWFFVTVLARGVHRCIRCDHEWPARPDVER